MNDCSLLVLSCDKYRDLWDPFFKLLKNNWGDCPFDIYLVTEAEVFNCDYLDVKTITNQKNGQWSRRLLEALKRIDSKYILFMLDDFFIKNKVDEAYIFQCLEWMEEDNKIACFSFVPSLWKDKNEMKYKKFVERPNGSYYRVNCQAGVWNKKVLMDLIKPYEDAWDFEWRASCRSNKTDYRFFALKKHTPWIIDYNYDNGGGGIHRGKWSHGVESVFAQNGIDVDFSIRGFDDNPAPPLGEIENDNPKPDWYSTSLFGNIIYIVKHAKIVVQDWINYK